MALCIGLVLVHVYSMMMILISMTGIGSLLLEVSITVGGKKYELERLRYPHILYCPSPVDLLKFEKSF